MRGLAPAHARHLTDAEPKSGTAEVSLEVCERSPESVAPDSGADLLDVPAAVVCANCGSPECPGCAFEEPTHASGVVAIVPWERPGMNLVRRVWTTARLATTSEAFFAALPDGDSQSALRFAVLAELLAVVGLLLLAMPLVLLAAPWLYGAFVTDSALRELFARALACGVPGIALGMVALHALHGVGLDLGARRAGARPRKSRGLRFGLYSCGWDLVTLPVGLIIVAFTEGPRAALTTAPLGLTVPSRAARAYLRGVHQLDEARARRAARFAAVLTGTLAMLGLAAAISTALIAA